MAKFVEKFSEAILLEFNVFEFLPLGALRANMIAYVINGNFVCLSLSVHCVNITVCLAAMWRNNK